MNHFPKLLSSQFAFDVARTMLDGFDKHYRIFREVCVAAQACFEAGDFVGIQKLQRDRIAYYDERVRECIVTLEDEFDAQSLDDDVWQQVKLHYIGLLTEHRQPELAETFFNSVCCKILHRSYFNNRFIFVRPAVATEYIENDAPAAKPTYRVYYPAQDGMAATLARIVTNFQLKRPFADLSRDVGYVMRAIEEAFGTFDAAPNFQIHVLASLFFRNKAAYIVGRIVNGDTTTPFAVPIVHDGHGKLALDAALLRGEQLRVMFSFSHAYFMVDMEVPSAYVQFLRTIMPGKPKAEIYTSVGLQKHGKNLFYRDFLHHLKHSSDKFVSAPGIPGLVMLVFTLPSYPYVFKLIRERFAPPKETTREQVKAKYLMVKQHDRVGRMADTLEFSSVAFPLSRFDDALLAQLRTEVPSLLEFDGDALVIRHCYIERRMTPLNLWLQSASDDQVDHAMREYGNAIKELMAANVFPGDMLYKNFGVTRHGRVVFYDYDELEYLTDCHIRRVPEPRNEEEAMSGEVWYRVGPHDVFPQTFETFLTGDARVRRYLSQHHPDFFDPDLWQGFQDRVRAGQMHDFYPYDVSLRFVNRYGAARGITDSGASDAPPRAAAA
ncbi:bifunctional isocitrate dehydrogenase kinase/phosphatase [Pandoraea sputorum]|uniref:Isocitrate dehydrogenase kinase/phosphatase n=2 Tax=Pandoraea TaxID=93217 RepID=A0A239S7G3_9BURK|nr:bifunctional isocitrate dehydrogenase kinase/phosphatase [Pandoraea sputorum]AJC15776.1 bifunctional isocitrate dehydrogenase kinase/phosphatase [Pandoraea sputorum]SNU81367.1 Isocitrate dehydrogenase kinase/phosphatase [Pandoraea sputorum]VVD67697.1 bifunctional isocitrate dehydrogenase kinase/phosphatase [Pandoraea sputorum]VVE81094.1 bifunctional isocitrate dehydrogenase kinase/phosphatase [Pandoraea sputorum]BET12883.1 bifunctional isocitrate dehydrogenase kinase/phosphatase [Pandoraea 